MLGLGLFGCGRIGRVHAATIARSSKARLVAVYDAIDTVAREVAESYGADVRLADEMMASADIDAILICSPTPTHFDLITAAAAAGKPVFCEKPVDMSADRIRAAAKLVSENNVPFLTAFNRRFDPSFALLESQLRQGAVGEIELVSITSRDPSPPPIGYIQSSGGIFRDMMIHDFDLARFLMDEDPVRVFASGSALVDPKIGEAGDVDTAVVVLTTASGKLCQISNSRRATYGYDQRIEVHGSAGMLQAQNIPEHSVLHANASGFRAAPSKHFFLERYETAYAAELDYFVDAVVSGTPMRPSIHDGLRAQMLADAATASLQSGAPVEIAP